MRRLNYGELERGFSLVEMMVASTIGLMLLGSVASLFLSSKRAYSDTERFGFISDNGRHAMTILGDNLRLVDFWGAARPTDIVHSGSLDAISSDCTGSAAGYSIKVALWGETPSSAAVAGCITDAAINSDALVIKHVAASPTGAAAISAGRTYLAANTTEGLLFDGADTAPSITIGGDVPNGTYWEYQASVYYVSTANSALPALMRKRLVGGTWGASEEIAAGVERLVLLYGVDSSGDGSADSYVSAATANWNNVVSIKLYFLMRSERSDPTYLDTHTYQLGAVTVDPNPDDGYHRAVFDTTITLRNRQLARAGGL